MEEIESNSGPIRQLIVRYLTNKKKKKYKMIPKDEINLWNMDKSTQE